MRSELANHAPAHWARRPVEDVCIRVTSGGTPSRRNAKFYENGKWAWVKTQELRDCWLDDTEEHITDDAISKSSAKVLSEQTLLLAIYGATVGQLGILRRPMTCNQACCAMIVDPEQADFRYLYYALIESRRQLKSLASGAAQQNLSGKLMREFILPFPDLPVQHRIANVLGRLDDKIELNRRMNRTLEKMAAAIFKSFFLDFDPVHAKAEGSDPGLPAEIADLFPNSFEDSDLGPIPKGWTVKALTEPVTINPKRTLAKGTLAPFLEMSNMPTRGPSPDAWRMREMTSGMKFINGDTLVARITPCLENGKTAFVDFLHNGQVGWGSTEYIVLRPCGEIPPVFAYLLARTPSFRTFAIRQMTGSSGRQRVPPQSLSKFQLALPELDSPVYRVLGDITQPFFARIRLAMMQSRRLAGLRDTLLPRLLSGEIELPEAKDIVEEVL